MKDSDYDPKKKLPATNAVMMFLRARVLGLLIIMATCGFGVRRTYDPGANYRSLLSCDMSNDNIQIGGCGASRL